MIEGTTFTPALDGNFEKLVESLVKCICVDFDAVGTCGVEPERRHITQRTGALFELGQSVVERPVRRPRIKWYVRFGG